MDGPKSENNISTRFIRKCNINESSIDSFRSLLKRIDWDLVKQNFSANDAYNIFLDLFTKATDQAFPETSWNLVYLLLGLRRVPMKEMDRQQK